MRTSHSSWSPLLKSSRALQIRTTLGCLSCMRKLQYLVVVEDGLLVELLLAGRRLALAVHVPVRRHQLLHQVLRSTVRQLTRYVRSLYLRVQWYLAHVFVQRAAIESRPKKASRHAG